MLKLFKTALLKLPFSYLLRSVPLLIAGTSCFAAEAIRFEEDVQPLFRQHCTRCHGETKQEGGFRLTTRESSLGVGDSEEKLIIAGKPEESLLIQRLVDHDLGDIMPLDSEPLTAQEIATLSTWIKQGAVWPDEFASFTHWAYEPIQRPTIPTPKNADWIRNPVDAFVLASQKKHGLQPAPEASPERWLRRVSLALTGLPPSREDWKQFAENPTPADYEAAVDRLLKSPRFGEKWAVSWLDLARYADSNGFQADQLRDSWAYRDWVINAFNSDMPFDQFVVEQIAGDLLPDATLEQKIATGFHRTVTCNVEAGVHPEENRVNQVFDRVNTTGTVFLATSMECAQCHKHKYDPFDQQDYYQLFAYFNNTPLEVKQTAGVTYDFYGPAMELPLPDETAQKRQQLLAEKKQLQKKQKEVKQGSEADYQAWIQQIADAKSDGQWIPLEVEQCVTTGGETVQLLPDHSVLITGKIPGNTTYHTSYKAPEEAISAIRLETLTHPELPGNGPGRGDKVRSNFVLHELSLSFEQGENSRRLSLGGGKADFSQDNWPVEDLIDGDLKTGWAISPEFGKPHWAQFLLLEQFEGQQDGQLKLSLEQNYGRGRTIGCFRLMGFTGDASQIDIPAEILEFAAKEKRNEKQEKKLRDHFSQNHPETQLIERQLADVEKEIKKIDVPTTLVMTEMEEQRTTTILNRGNYLDPGDPVEPGIPSLFAKNADKYAPNRLGLAEWLVSDDDPLLARVTVNRWWAELFGQGIVTTLEDFGSQGEAPTHPELLDWLAAELKSSGWSMKHILKTIVLSSTYRQNSRLTAELLEVDPKNRWYARGPRFRLPAELIRDNALSISGLLSDKMGGPPIMPYQPNNIWRSIGRNQPKWNTAQDEDRFRRGVYVIWKRDAPYTSFTNFDAPDRTACVVNRPRTNTPLQALTLLNDPAFAEMAVGLTSQIMRDAPSPTDHARLMTGFELTVCREPSTEEISILQELLDNERERIKQDPKLIEQRAQWKLKGFPENQDVPSDQDFAAWCGIANVLLNLDETVCQQ